MGCDICSYAEVRGDDGTWHVVGEVFPNSYYMPDLEMDEDDWNRPFTYEPFHLRDYNVYDFLANVRNYSGVTPLSLPKGLPVDLSDSVRAVARKVATSECAHSYIWLDLWDLLDVDYDAEIEDRRVCRPEPSGVWNGGATAGAGEGKVMPLREFLGAEYFVHLEILKGLGAPDRVRIIFWFWDCPGGSPR